ncbi:MAG TPA: ABC transporter ATP-binding protein [Gemmatimonadales bacterium]|nr:ABC transporter ATP-binding protein [Gemmatimonadales bacterium]
MLTLRAAKERSSFSVDVEIEQEEGRTLVVVGESGSGKSTLLRLLAGLERPDRGHIALGGETWFDEARSGGTWIPPWARPIGYVGQDYALFPHLTVWENVAFGLDARGWSRRDLRDRVARVLDRLAMTPLADRRPREISGGQQQRAALARALAPKPRLLLLDEPLSALDQRTRQEVRGELKAVLDEAGCTTVFVTHAPVEALLFGDRIAVLEEGRLTQLGDREDLLRRPRSSYVASLLGVNLFRGTVVQDPGSAAGLVRVRTKEGSLLLPDPGLRGDVFVTVNPRDVTLYLTPPVGSAQNIFHGEVTEVVPQPPDGERVRVVLRTRPPLVTEVTHAAAAALNLRAGAWIHAGFKATGTSVYGAAATRA